jgi:hypothetical protein
MRRAGLIVTICLGIVVAASAHAAAGPTLTSSTQVVAFGQNVVLRGTAPGVDAGETVEIIASVCGFTGDVPVGETKTTAGGSYVYTLEPMLNATLFTRVGAVESPHTSITVRPDVQLRRVKAGRYAVDVSVGNGTWFAKPVTLQRLDPRMKKWKTVATAVLKANSDPEALVAVSSAIIRAHVLRGTQLRAAVPPATVGSCYLPATSQTIVG